MARRVKPQLDIPTISSLEEADATLARISSRRRELELINLGMQEEVDRLKTAAAAQGAPILQDIAAMEQALIRFGLDSKATLFDKRKSVDMTFGTIGFRTTSTLKTLRKITWDTVLGRLEQAGQSDCIRTKREVDKEAMRKLPLDVLGNYGCTLNVEDVFFYETAEADAVASPQQ